MSTFDPKWRKVLLSGSNVHAHEITASGLASAVSDPSVQKVIVYDTNSGAFYYTGSYGSGGTGGGGNPANPTDSVQFNNAGNFGGDSGFIFDDSQAASLLVDGPITASNISGSGTISGSSIVATSEFKITKTPFPTRITTNVVGGTATMELQTTDDADGLDLATRILLRGASEGADIEFYRGVSGSEIPIAAFGGTHQNFAVGNFSTGSNFDTFTSKSRLIVSGNMSTTGSTGHITASGDIVIGQRYSASDSANENGKLIVNRDNTKKARIEFPTHLDTLYNDPGYIEHFSNGDTGVLRFAPADNSDGSSNDRLEFGNRDNQQWVVMYVNDDGGPGVFTSGAMEARGQISSSNHLFASTSFAGAGDYNNVVLYDTATGKFYHTGSYGSGGSGGGGIAMQGSTADGVLTRLNSTTASVEANLRFNTTTGLRVYENAQFNYNQSGIFGGNGASTGYKAGQFLESGQHRTYVTPQRISNRPFYLVGVQGKQGVLSSAANYLVYSGSVFFDPTTDGKGGHGGGGTPDQDDGTFTTKGRIQAIDAEERTGITISGNPSIYFFDVDASASVSSSFNFDSASAEIKFDTGSKAIKFFTGNTTESLSEVLHISESSGRPRIGIGTTAPIKALDFLDKEDSTEGTEILLRSSRVNEGAQAGDSAGKITFVINSASFANVEESGSVAAIEAKVNAIDQFGTSGELDLKVSPGKVNSPVSMMKLTSGYNHELTGSLDMGASHVSSGILSASRLYVSSGADFQGNNAHSFISKLSVGANPTQLTGFTRFYVGANAIFTSDVNIGNQASDTHTIEGHTEFIGSITASGNISSSNNFIGSGVTSYGDIHLATNNTQITQILANGVTTRDLIGFDDTNTAVVGNVSTNKVALIGDVTASNNISASGTITGNSIVGTLGTPGQPNITTLGTLLSLTMGGDIDVDGNTIDLNSGDINNAQGINGNVLRVGNGTAGNPSISFTSDTDTGIYHAPASDNMVLQAGGGTGELTINTGGVSVNSGNLQYNSLKLSKTTTVAGNHDGADVVFFGSTTGMDTGKLYYYNSSGGWTLTDADAASTSTGLLGVALGASSNTNGVLLKGMVTLDHDPGDVGDVLFLQTGSNSGLATPTAPSNSGDIVRIIGYCLDASNGQIYFNPSPDFIEVS